MSPHPFSLKGKTVLVTGASSGIGRSVAIECAKAGATVCITGRNRDRLEETYNQLPGSHPLPLTIDFTHEEQVESLLNQCPRLEGVVHAAGIVDTVPFQFITQEKLANIFLINLMSPTLISRQLLGRDKISKGASIVWISSISGTSCSFLGNSMYSSTKGAVNGMVKGMALDLARKGIRVNSINPGQIDTNLLSQGAITEEQLREETKKYPLKRFGKPEEVAYAAIYLLSDSSAWVTGSHLLIDGGYTLQ